MRSLACPVCRRRVYFENDLCLGCGTALGFDPSAFVMREVVPPEPSVVESGVGTDVVADVDRPVRCANVSVAGCNWVVPGSAAGQLCRSCSLTRTRPPDDDPEAMQRFLEAEVAKRRLVAQLIDLDLPIVSFEEHDEGLGFDLLSSRFDQVMIGHDDGLITLDLAEVDDVHRERVRSELGEVYRTVLGHFRHEVGHYYWNVLVRDGHRLEEFRNLFGDERADYDGAISSHYGGVAPTGWEESHVSSYATMHPWEDWAETFAHLLHLTDTLQTASEMGVRVEDQTRGTVPTPDPDQRSFDTVVADWIALSAALNAINRSMGSRDLYPFVLAPAVIEKLAFVHGLVRATA